MEVPPPPKLLISFDEWRYTRPKTCVKKKKYRCRSCRPCPHGHIKHGCMSCTPCPHNLVKANCKECLCCRHGIRIYDCMTCNYERRTGCKVPLCVVTSLKNNALG